MKKLLLSIVLSSGFVLCFAQNYECLKPNTKQYFINSFSYLRGMRIDSVSVQGNTTYYFPFHTPRGRYEPPFNQPNYVVQPLDTNGGSWLGKKVTALQDGTWLFDNYWGDTVMLKTKANVGDNWVLFNDTTNIYYTATVTGKDTMTVMSTLDSVKIITINAYHNAILDPADMLNGAKIILSKNHGFAQAMDLYMLPLHEPDMTYAHGFDHFLDHLSYTGPNAANITFKQVEFHNPDALELYNYSPGDVFEWEGDNSCADFRRIDSIVSKNAVSPTEIQYAISRWNYQFVPPPNQSLTTFYTNTLNVDAGTVMIIDTVKMPEESVITKFYYYDPLDSTQCKVSAMFGNADNFIVTGNGYSVNTFEPCGAGYKYKNGFGKIYDAECFDPTLCNDHFDQMTYSFKAGNPNGPCGSFSPIPLGLKQLTINANTIAPNPANNYITITTKQIPYSLTIFNMLGQPVLSAQGNKATESFDVSRLPAGMYSTRLQQADGYSQSSKLLIEH